MLKKSCLTGAALLLALPAFAQTGAPTTSTTYGTAPTVVVGSTGCTITGASVFNYNPNTNTLTLQNGVDSCSSTTPGNLTASVSISINPTSYTLGSGAAAPVISWTNQTPAASVNCTLTPNNGFTIASSTANTFTLSTPTVAGTYSFSPTCTTSTAGYNTAVSVSGSASLTVVNGNTGGGTTGCSASQLSTPVNGVTFQRQCSTTGFGPVYFLPSTTSYSGNLTDLGAVLGNKSFPAYSYVGYAPTFTIGSGYYVSLAFTPTVSGMFKLTANNSYGDGGTISLSTSPGGLTSGAAGVICALPYNGLNSLLVSTTSGSCQVTQGQTYYVNFADTDINGANLCFGQSAGSCQSSTVAYTLSSAKAY